MTLPGQYPVVKLAMKYEKIKPVAAEFTPRAVNDSLDPAIEAEIKTRTHIGELPEKVNHVIDSLISGKPIQTLIDATRQDAIPEGGQTQSQTIVEPTAQSVIQNPTLVTTENASSENPPEAQGGQEVIIDNVKVNTDTGEVLGRVMDGEENPHDLYDSYTRMRQEEKEFLDDPHASHSNSSPDLDREYDNRWGKW